MKTTNEKSFAAPFPLSVHDNRLLSIAMDGERRRIVFRTVYEAAEGAPERTDVVFSDVLAYHFVGDNFRSILFDVSESPLSGVVESWRDVFAARQNYGWLPFAYTEISLHALLSERNVRAFVVSSSYGMDGFVLAAAMEILPGEK